MEKYKFYIKKEDFIMKKEEIKEEVKEEVTEAKEVTVIEEEKESFLIKAKNGLKKHGKKVAVGAAVAVAGVVGYMLGSKTEGDSDYVDSYAFDDSNLSGESDSNEVTEN